MVNGYFIRWAYGLNFHRVLRQTTVLAPTLLVGLMQLSGCTSMGKKDPSANESDKASQEKSLEATDGQEPPPDSYRPFEKSTLFDLMAAEMAAKDKRLDITLGNYLKQAHYTKDPGVIARALRFARYMKAYQATLNAARLWLSIEPNNQEALQAATIELIRVGRYDEAIEHIDTLLQLSAMINFDFLVEHSKPLTKDRRSEIIKHLASLLQKYPSHPQLWFTKALLEGQNGDNKTALQDINQTLFLKKDYLSAVFYKAKILMALDEGGEAVTILKKALSSNPDNMRIRIALAKAYLELNQLEKAQAEFEILVKKNPDDSDLKLSLALISWENKLEDRAIHYLQELVDNGQKLDEANTYLGNIAAKKQQYEKAITYFRQVSTGPHYTRAQIYIAQLQAEQGQIEAAESTLQYARTKSPHSAVELYITQSDILSNAKRFQSAHELLSAALSSFPNDPGLLYTRALVAESMGRLDQLEVDLKTIIEIDPGSALALNALGYTLADQTDRLEEAETLVRQAIELEPNDPAIMDSLGWVYFKKGELEKSVYWLQKAYSILPNGEIAAHLGEVLWNLNKQRLAKKIWRNALKDSPDHPILLDTMKRLGVKLP